MFFLFVGGAAGYTFGQVAVREASIRPPTSAVRRADSPRRLVDAANAQAFSGAPSWLSAYDLKATRRWRGGITDERIFTPLRRSVLQNE